MHTPLKIRRQLKLTGQSAKPRFAVDPNFLNVVTVLAADPGNTASLRHRLHGPRTLKESIATMYTQAEQESQNHDGCNAEVKYSSVHS